MSEPANNRDVIVIGASAGGLDALRILLADLPGDLPAAIFVVLHVGEVSHLDRVLDRVSSLLVTPAANAEPFKNGHVYVAPPGKHMLLHDGHILLRRGPRENFARPAVDPLFRSAGVSRGGRVIGVILSGALADGTAGLAAVKRCGGLAVVQELGDALVPDMPASALRYVEVDHVVPVTQMAPLLSRLSREAAGPTLEVPVDIRLEAAIAAQELAGMKVNDALGTPSPFICPDCGGALWEIEDGKMLRYRCHIGHAISADAVLASRSAEIDRLLSTLLRSHRERAEVARRLSRKERADGRSKLAAQLERRASEYDDDAELVKGLMRNGGAEGGVVTNDNLRSPLLYEEER
jgi:two-component system chemotaxis response regulator CheB